MLQDNLICIVQPRKDLAYILIYPNRTVRVPIDTSHYDSPVTKVNVLVLKTHNVTGDYLEYMKQKYDALTVFAVDSINASNEEIAQRTIEELVRIGYIKPKYQSTPVTEENTSSLKPVIILLAGLAFLLLAMYVLAKAR